jgi:hypothetical protein
MDRLPAGNQLDQTAARGFAELRWFLWMALCQRRLESNRQLIGL